MPDARWRIVEYSIVGKQGTCFYNGFGQIRYVHPGRCLITGMYLSNWQLKGHFSQKRKFCALLAISHHRRDLFIIQSTDKPYLVYSVELRRKTTENLSVGCHYFFFGVHLAQPVQLGCAADFERFWPILGPKFNRIPYFLVSGFPLDIFKISGQSGRTV